MMHSRVCKHERTAATVLMRDGVPRSVMIECGDCWDWMETRLITVIRTDVNIEQVPPFGGFGSKIDIKEEEVNDEV